MESIDGELELVIQKNVENSVMRAFIICICHHVILLCLIKIIMNGLVVYAACMRDKKSAYWTLVGNLKEGGHWSF
jgi:hypothetical protein